MDATNETGPLVVSPLVNAEMIRSTFAFDFYPPAGTKFPTQLFESANVTGLGKWHRLGPPGGHHSLDGRRFWSSRPSPSRPAC